MQRNSKFKQWWSTIPTISTKRTITFHFNSLDHWCCELEYRSGWGVQHYVIKFVSDLRQAGGFLRILRFLPPIENWPPRYYWNIVDSGVKHHQAKPDLRLRIHFCRNSMSVLTSNIDCSLQEFVENNRKLRVL